METETRRGAFWPTPAQEHLLRAALLRGPAALAAWEAWSAQTDLDSLDAASFRLLPLLYVNLQAEGAERAKRAAQGAGVEVRVLRQAQDAQDAGEAQDVQEARDRQSLKKLKGIYRYHWSGNQVLFHDAAAVLDRLQAAGVQTLLLMGPALATLYYPNPGLRPVDEFDVLVPLSQAARAAEVLAEAGWQPLLAAPAERLHARLLLHPAGARLRECRRPEVRPALARALPGLLPGRRRALLAGGQAPGLSGARDPGA